MLKVMIVDDELIVRVALRSIVDWEALGFEIVAEAKDGAEGLEKYRKYRPRLILTDVLMPEMDGLEMMRHIRAEDDEVRFVVLSSYDDFTYAQQAMRMDADEYLLKASLMEEDVEQLVQRMFRKLTSEGTRAAEGGAGWFARQLESGADPLAVKSEWDSLLRGKPGCVVLFRLAGGPADSTQTRILQGILENILSDAGVPFVPAPWREGVLILTAALPEAQSAMLAGQLRRTTVQYLSRELRIGVSQPVDTPEGLSNACAQAHDAGVQTLFAPEQAFGVFQPQQDGTHLLKSEMRERLRTLLMNQQAQEACALLDPLFDILRRQRDHWRLYELVLELSALLCEYRDMREPDKPERVMQIDDIEKIRQFYHASVEAAVSSLREGSASINPYIARARAYIATHYAEGVTLSDVASQLHLSSSYLGKLFYAETGSYLADYVNSVRIERACESMREGDDSLSVIAEQVGFCNQAYFTRLFQKQKGVSPSVYRRECRNAQKNSSSMQISSPEFEVNTVL